MLFPQNSFSSIQEFLSLLSDISPKHIRYELEPVPSILFFVNDKNKINKHVKEYQIKNVLFVFKPVGNSFIHNGKVISSSDSILFEVDFLTDQKFYDNVFVISLKELIQNCPIIDRKKVTEMVQNKIKKEIKHDNQVIEEEVLVEGIGDLFKRKDDTPENPALDAMISGLESNLKSQGASWANLYKSLKKLGIKNNMILQNLINILDETEYTPDHNIISAISNKLVNKISSDNSGIKIDDEILEKRFDSQLKELITAFRANYSFSNDNLLTLIKKLSKDEIINKKPEQLIQLCFKKAGLSDNTIERFKKKETDLDYQFNQELDAQDNKDIEKEKDPKFETQNKLKDLISALRNQGYNKKQAIELTKSLDPKDIQTKSVEDLYLMAMKKQGNSLINQKK